MIWSEEGGSKRGETIREQLLLFLVGPLLTVFHRALEILDAFAKTFAEIGQLARSEDQKCNAEQKQKLGYS